MDISALGFGLRKVPGMLDQLRNSLNLPKLLWLSGLERHGFV